jgi:hypothetical protein
MGAFHETWLHPVSTWRLNKSAIEIIFSWSSSTCGRKYLQWNETVQPVQWQTTAWTAGIRFPTETSFLSAAHNFLTDSVSAKQHYRWHDGLPCLIDLALMPEPDHALPPSAEVKNRGAMPPLPHTFLWRGACSNKHWYKFIVFKYSYQGDTWGKHVELKSENQTKEPTLETFEIRAGIDLCVTKIGNEAKDCMYLCKIWGFHDGDYEEWRLLGCYAVWLL